MRYPYPRLNNFIHFSLYNEEYYKVENFLDHSVILVSIRLFEFGQLLDGKTDPYKADPNFTKKEVEKALRLLGEINLISNNKIIYDDKQKKSGYKIHIFHEYETKHTELYFMLYILILIVTLISSGYFILNFPFSYSNLPVFNVNTFIGIIVGIFINICFHLTGEYIKTRSENIAIMDIRLEKYFPFLFIGSELYSKNNKEKVTVPLWGSVLNLFSFFALSNLYGFTKNELLFGMILSIFSFIILNTLVIFKKSDGKRFLCLATGYHPFYDKYYVEEFVLDEFHLVYYLTKDTFLLCVIFKYFIIILIVFQLVLGYVCGS